MSAMPKMVFTKLKSQIVSAIKESCYRTDARLYNIANEVHHIPTFSLDPKVESSEGLLKIIDKTVKESMVVGCDMSVIVKGILVGAFRASPFTPTEAPKTLRILIKEILHSLFKYKSDVKQSVEGLVSAILTIAFEFKLNEQEVLAVAKQDILSITQALSPQWADDFKAALPNLEGPTA